MSVASMFEVCNALGARKNGAQWLARCVVHEDSTPSMSLRATPDGRLLVHCHAGCDQAAIVDELKRRNLWPDGVRDDAVTRGRLSDAEREEKAREIWRAGRSASGTLVERYLRSRAITLKPPPTLRFIEDAFHAESGRNLPALIAAVAHWPSSSVTAVQRIFLRGDGEAKADVEPAKKSLGTLRGGAVRLAAAGYQLGLAEGIEDALSAMQLDPKLPCWATLGATNLVTVELPPLPQASRVTIIADNDRAGMKAAYEAASRFRREGRTALIARPPKGAKDFNEALQQQARGVA